MVNYVKSLRQRVRAHVEGGKGSRGVLRTEKETDLELCDVSLIVLYI